MPQVLIDGISYDVDDVATAQGLNAAFKEQQSRIDALQGEIANKDSQLSLFKEDEGVPPQFQKKEEEPDDEEPEVEDADEMDDEEPARSEHDAEMEALRAERDALQGQLDALMADQDDPTPEPDETRAPEEEDEEMDEDSLEFDSLLGSIESADAEARADIFERLRSLFSGPSRRQKKLEKLGRLGFSANAAQKRARLAKGRNNAEDARDDSEEGRAAWFTERKELIALANALRLDSVDELTNLELKRAVVGKYTDKDASEFSADRLDGALPHIKDKIEARQDSLDAAGRALLPSRPQQRTDAQSSYRNSTVNAWKQQRSA